MRKVIVYGFLASFLCFWVSKESRAECLQNTESKCAQSDPNFIGNPCESKFNLENARINLSHAYYCGEKGDSSSIFQIGLDYFNGYPDWAKNKMLNQDYVLAYTYFLISAKFGEKKGVDALNMTERWRRSLTSEGEKQAKLLADSWHVGEPLPRISSNYKNSPLFKKINKHTLLVHGHIYFGAYKDFIKEFSPLIDTIILDSPGGSIAAAAQIGEVLKDKSVTAIVDGECLSACANYLFVAAHKRIVSKDSILGFHGGAKKGKNIDHDYEIIKKAKGPALADKQRRILNRIVAAEFGVLDKYKIPHSIVSDDFSFMVPPSLKDELHDDSVLMWFPDKEQLSDYNIVVEDMWYPEGTNPENLLNFVRKFEYNLYGVPAIFDKDFLTSGK